MTLDQNTWTLHLKFNDVKQIKAKMGFNIILIELKDTLGKKKTYSPSLHIKETPRIVKQEVMNDTVKKHDGSNGKEEIVSAWI